MENKLGKYKIWLILPYWGCVIVHALSMRLLKEQGKYTEELRRRQWNNWLFCFLAGVAGMVIMMVLLVAIAKLTSLQSSVSGYIKPISALIAGWCVGLPCLNWLGYLKKQMLS